MESTLIDNEHPLLSTSDLADKLEGWAERARCAQIALDLAKDPESVAIRAGQLLDLAEDIERVRASLLDGERACRAKGKR